MKKKILSIVIAAFTLTAFSSMAQGTPSENNIQKKENTKFKKFKSKRERAEVNPFEGINLTDAQKTQLQQLKEKRIAARKQDAQARKENKQRNDSSRLAARTAAKKAYLEEIKAIIGPDQYVIFLENAFVNGGNHPKAAKQGNRFGKRSPEKGMKPGQNKAGKSQHHAFNNKANSTETGNRPAKS